MYHPLVDRGFVKAVCVCPGEGLCPGVCVCVCPGVCTPDPEAVSRGSVTHTCENITRITFNRSAKGNCGHPLSLFLSVDP